MNSQPVPPMTEIHELQLTVAKLGAALQDHQNKIEYLEAADVRLTDKADYLADNGEYFSRCVQDIRLAMKNLAVNRMAYVHKRTRRWMRWIYCAPEKKRPQ